MVFLPSFQPVVKIIAGKGIGQQDKTVDMAPVANGDTWIKEEVASSSHEIITIGERVGRAQPAVRSEEMAAESGVPLVIDNGMSS